MTNIFKTVEEMPPKDNSPDVVRTAQSMSEMHRNYLPASMPQNHSVENIVRPRRGHGY